MFLHFVKGWALVWRDFLNVERHAAGTMPSVRCARQNKKWRRTPPEKGGSDGHDGFAPIAAPKSVDLSEW